MSQIKKTTLFITLLTTTTLLIFAFPPSSAHINAGKSETSDDGILFEKDGWQAALSKAKKENKLVFLDAYTSWCGPCKLLQRTSFRNKTVGMFFNKNYINVAVDMENGIGTGLAKKYGVSAYPTLLIINSSGDVVTYTIGYVSSKQLLEFGKYGLAPKRINAY